MVDRSKFSQIIIYNQKIQQLFTCWKENFYENMHKTVLITGSNRGLGLSLVKEFLEQDFTVYSLSRSVDDSLRELRSQFSGELICYVADVTDEGDLKEIAQDFSGHENTIDILINNAAVHLEQPPPDVGELNFKNILETFRVNSVAPLAVIQHFLPFIQNLIVNISSEAGSIENCWRDREYGYCMSKAALNMASKILHNRLKGENVKVLAVHPQWFRSDMGGTDAPITPDEAAAYVRKTVLKDWSLEDPIYVDSKTADEIAW